MNTEKLSGTLQAQGKLSGSFSSTEALKGNLANEALRGYSAYQVAVLNGFKGTEQEWLESMVLDQVVADCIVKDDGSGNVTLITKGVVENGEEPTVPTRDYTELKNKPHINGVELNGAITLEKLGLTGHGLKYDNEKKQLAVNMAESVEKDNTLPISSADVYTVVGNIGVLLETI